MIPIANDDIDNWLIVLKPYQADSIRLLINEYGDENAAEKWLTANGPSNQVAFGGISDQNQDNTFYTNFKIEFHKFICGDPKYETERNRLGVSLIAPKQLIISIISGALGATFGVTGALLAPAVCVLLFIVGKMGVNAYCAT